MKFTWKNDGMRILMVLLGSTLYAINLKSFVRAGNLLPGGLVGISVLIQQIGTAFFNIEIPYSVVNLLLNMIPIAIGIRFIGKKFTIYSCTMIIVSSFLTDILPVQPLTYDVLLICIFGGMLNGFAISLCLNAGASSGGLDFVSIYMSNKKKIDCFNYILALNALILIIAGCIFDWNRALYSIIFQFASTQVIHLLYRKHQKNTLMVITNKPEDVYHTISDCTNHGATVFKGIGGYEHKDRYLVYSVVSTSEVKTTCAEINKTDPKAFINTFHTEQVKGRFVIKEED